MTTTLAPRARFNAPVSPESAHNPAARETITLVADDLAVGIMTVGGTGRITFVNRAIERILGYYADELIGEPLDVIIPTRMRGTYTEALRHFLATGQGAFHAWTGVRLSALHRAGHEVPLEVSFSESTRNGERMLTGVLRDLSAESEAASALRFSEARFRTMTESSQLGTFVMDPAGACIYTNPAYHAITRSEPSDALGMGWRLLVHPDDLDETLRFGGAVVTERASARREIRHVRSNGDVVWTTVRLTPIMLDEEVVGCVGTLEDITDQRNARELELDIGARIQEMFLHGELPPASPAYSVGVVAEASRRLTGDFHDFFLHGEKVLDVVLGDVMGSGIPAALLGAATKSRLVREIALAPRGASAPEISDVIARLDRSVGERLAAVESFSTLCYARIDTAERRLELVSCGHPHVLHVSGVDGAAHLVEGANTPLGFAPGSAFQTTHAPLGDGDIVVLYSDGLTDARSTTGRTFDVQRLMDVVRAYRREPAPVIARAIWRAVVKFTESLAAGDDLTCIVVRIEPRLVGAPDPESWEGEALFPSLTHVRAFVRSFCERLSPRPDAAWENALVLATHEAAANVIRHDSTARRLYVSARVEAGAIEVRVSHDGTSYAPGALTEPTIDERAEHGYGLFLIRRNVDETRYDVDACQRPGVTLRKNLPARPLGLAADTSRD